MDVLDSTMIHCTCSDVLTTLARCALSIYLPEVRLRFKADAHAEAGGCCRRVAAGGADLAPDSCLQLPFVCKAEGPVCQQYLLRSLARAAVHILGGALGKHHEQRNGMARVKVWLNHVPHLGRVRARARAIELHRGVYRARLGLGLWATG